MCKDFERMLTSKQGLQTDDLLRIVDRSHPEVRALAEELELYWKYAQCLHRELNELYKKQEQ
jgi:hypothetical protein